MRICDLDDKEVEEYTCFLLIRSILWTSAGRSDMLLEHVVAELAHGMATITAAGVFI
jgi:hypothetical protein